MSPLRLRSRPVARALDPGHQLPRVTMQALLDARRGGRESSAAMLPALTRQAPSPVTGLPPELDATRVGPPSRHHEGIAATATSPTRPRHHVVLPDGRSIELPRAAVAGRAPSSRDDADVLVLVDPTRSVSRCHAHLEPSPDGVVVTDLGSANGTTVRHRDGSLHDAGDGVPVVAEPGSTIHLGDVALTVTAPPVDPGA